MNDVQEGDRVEFLGFGITDKYSDLKEGTLGTVDHIDSLGTIHVKWDSGGRLGLVQKPLGHRPDFVPDRFRIVERVGLT